MLVSPNPIPTFLPDEIIFNILHFLDPCDAIRLRLVSKQFNDVTRDARLWRTFYTNSRLPRPSGPFLWQSTRSLQHALIHSMRVSQTWTLQPFGIVSRVHGPRIPAQPCSLSTPSDFLFGRLFIWCEHEQLLVQDLETGIGRVLWQSTDHISSLNACSLTFPDAQRVFIAIRHVDAPFYQRTPIKLLEFPLEDDVRLTLGPLAFEMDLPEYATFPLSASAPFLCFHGGVDRILGTCEPVVIDIRTWTTYKFPVFSSSLDPIIHRGDHPWWPGFTLLSGDYIIVFSPWQHRVPPMTLIQAFVIPDLLAHPSHVDMGQLLLTHEVLVDHYLAPTHRLRDVIVDPQTGGTSVRFLGADPRHEKTYYLCMDVTIPPIESGSTGVLSMSVNTQELLVLSGYPHVIFLDASDDGYGRGMVTLCKSLESPEPGGHLNRILYKFSIDASGERCTAIVSEPSTLSSQDVFHYADFCVFDGVTGRMCHSIERCNFFDLMVLDLH